MRRSFTAAVTGTLLVLAACGGADDPIAVRAGSALAAVQQAPDAAAEAGSAHLEMVMTVTMPGTTEPVEVTGEGDYDLDAGLLHLRLDLGALFEQLGGLGDAIPEGVDGPMEVVVDGDTAYLNVPFLGLLTGSEGWLSMSAADVGERGLGSFGAGGLGAGMDPSAVLDHLRGAGEVTEVGPAEIDGVDTTEYLATIDLAKALDEVPAEGRAALEDQIGQLGELEDLPISLWLDGAGLPRRVELRYEVPGQGEAAMTMTWSDYGEPVTVQVPDPGEVTPAAEVLGDLGGMFGGQG